ncbi:hypothetical protein LRS73_34145 (plasmid) [Methylobacterium currus]|uniref:hypothetical protein n=1 Tax=Methylobacterium currus TaxID=2051553 RepID=UPI001E4410D5|nr:hypothetical protein [Methylobacterium currus]UHC20012.1 hypothetical protein LRS73_34145 [Methylobacterium currus]
MTYLNTSDTPDTAPRTIGMSVNDGALDSPVASRTVSVVSINDAPSFADSLGGRIAYTEQASPVVLAAGVTVSDAELSALGTYAGASLTLARQDGASPDDRFSARVDGSLGPLTEGASLTYDGTVLGTVTRNSGGVLTLIFSGGSAAQVSGVLREIAYANTSDAPPAQVVLGWTFSDGNAGA